MAAHRSLFHGVALPASSPPRFALGAKGFRPFFLLAAAFACAIVPLWLLVLAGFVRPTAYLDAVSWHAHEMVFGFAVAVIAGFLLTAVGNWTGRETLVGAPLLALAGLWTAGRAAMFCAGALPRGLPALVDLAFLPVLAVVLARPLVATGNRRNFVMIGVVAALFVANVVVHLAGLGVLPGHAARRADLAGVDVVLLVILVMAGRVFPTFTRNATRAEGIVSSPRLDVATVAAMAALTLMDAADLSHAGVVAGGVGVLALVRASRWGTRHVARHPLLWILHAGYAWLVLGLLLRALAEALPAIVPAVAPSFATHALTVGAIGCITLGMMARVALGHTGRPILPPRLVAMSFAALLVAAAVRVFAPLLCPGHLLAALVVAGALWTAAFGIYLVVYTPMLLAPRIEGKSG